MTEYKCEKCDIESPCVLTVKEGTDTPFFCPYRNDIDEDPADWKRVALEQAHESEEILNDYIFRLHQIEISTKQDVNETIKLLEHCIINLLSIDWPEDLEIKARLGVTA